MLSDSLFYFVLFSLFRIIWLRRSPVSHVSFLPVLLCFPSPRHNIFDLLLFYVILLHSLILVLTHSRGIS